MFATAIGFNSSPIFGGKAGAYQRGIPYEIPLYGRLLALPANIGLNRTEKGINALAYYDTIKIRP